ncbi:MULTISPECIES: copper resistance protein NlpE [Olivibacter]|uniref:Copper resistance protein NlpE n=1 Tax=Olivibacter jilunii TaxID=985016 RepID=A0ABW6B404_9SPHI|nr:copper resistance protein NlpE [Olivibacter sp. UJ_SKK_5.1]MDX3915882.1 copper resistance protein NlpE [Pseudosphingobacterium sp.]
MIKRILTYVLVSGIFWSCNNGTKGTGDINTTDTTTEEYVPIDATSDTADMHNAQNSLDVVGIYKGVLPCADCEGINTELELKADSTYTLKNSYLGKGDSQSFEEDGRYVWIDGSTIELKGGRDAPGKYFVGENTLTQLDMNGDKITGALADKYILRK